MKATENNVHKQVQYFCDESGINHESQYFAIGMLKTNRSQRRSLLSSIAQVRQEFDFQNEIHFHKFSSKREQVYKALIHNTLRQVDYRVIIVKRSLVNPNLFGSQDYLMLNFFTRIMVEKFVKPGSNAVLYLDSRSRDKRDNGIQHLKRQVNLVKPGSLKSIEEIDSKKSELIQLSDLYLGLLRYGYEHGYSGFELKATNQPLPRKEAIYREFISLVCMKRCKSRFKRWEWKPNEERVYS